MTLAPPFEKIDPEFGPFGYLHKQEIKGKKVCYFAAHSVFAEVLDYVYDYLRRILEIDYEIIYISSSTLTEKSIIKLKEYCSVIIQKTNGGGDDFGAWKIGLSETDYGAGLDGLVLVNDSVFGPMRSIREDAERLGAEYDLWGYSINMEIALHVQSYFLACNKKMIDSGFVRDFWSKVVLMKIKDEWIKAYEIGFSQAALKRGFTIGAIADARDLKAGLKLPSPYLNYTIAAWKELIVKYKFPVLKREVLMKDIAQATNAGWKDAVASVFPEYPLEYIDEYIEKYRKEILDERQIPYATVPKDVISLIHFHKKITKDQLCALGVAKQITTRLDQPLLCYQLKMASSSPILDELDTSFPFHYLGALDAGLLEQYIYHWNRQNVRALVVDYDTYRLFSHYFQSFYSGNIWVVSEEDGAVRIVYFIRGEKTDEITVPLSNKDILSEESQYVNLKSDKEFLKGYHYSVIKRFTDENGIGLNWIDSDITGTARLKGLTIVFSNYSFQLFSGHKEVYFTEEPQDICTQLEIEINSFLHEEFRIIDAMEKPVVEQKDITRLYNRCFLHPEYNIKMSPRTSSFVHFYYEDSLYDLLPYIYNLTYLYDHQFFFSISEETFNRHKIARKLRHIFPGCQIQIVRNTGKDIGGKLNTLKLYFELGRNSEYMLMLHDKKSLHSWAIEGSEWRTELFKIAEPQFIHQIISTFKDSPRLGMVGNKKWLNNTDFDYNNDRFAFHDSFFRKRLKEYGMSISNYQFVAGTMFWIREGLLREFFARYSFLEILERLEKGNILDSKEGTETHFLERFFGWFATSEGYELSGI